MRRLTGANQPNFRGLLSEVVDLQWFAFSFPHYGESSRQVFTGFVTSFGTEVLPILRTLTRWPLGARLLWRVNIIALIRRNIP